MMCELRAMHRGCLPVGVCLTEGFSEHGALYLPFLVTEALHYVYMSTMSFLLYIAYLRGQPEPLLEP